MTTNKNLAEDLKWEDVCQDHCYSPYDHSHNPTLGKDFKKDCPNCECEMKLDAQIFGNKFGYNEAVLFNAYECETCKGRKTHTLYEGPQKSPKAIYESAKSALSS